MKILYAIQGTGNGHISRAIDIIPALEQKGSVDVLVSGGNQEMKLPFDVTYQMHGLGFVFGKKGGIDYWRTYKQFKIKRVFGEILSLPVKNYDIIINDFEPISAWAGILKNVPVIALSHQAAVLDTNSPKPKNINSFERFLLNYYAPAKYKYGFHFQPYNDFIFSPVIRNEIRNKLPIYKNHYTVYLPAYSDKKIIKVLSQIKEVNWKVFSKHSKETYLQNNVMINPIDNKQFIDSLITCKGVLCGAGFETPAEALFLKKKLLVIPMKGQFEQKCNAIALKKMGVCVLDNFNKKQLHQIQKWIHDDLRIEVSYPNITKDIIDHIFAKHVFKREIYEASNKEVELG